MKMKRLTAVTLSLLSVVTLGLSGCKPTKRELVYPDEGYATADSDSWKQLGDAEEISIDWYVNMASWGTAATRGTLVEQKIYEATKIRVNFITPILDDGAQLSTMIAGDKLPDVVTVGAGGEESIQLALEGYAYPIQTLAQKYAPTLLNRIDDEIKAQFAMPDGNIYGIPNHYYTASDMEAYAEQEGKNLNSNGAMVVRKDYLDQYTRTYPNADITTASGFLEMCKWVKNRYNLSDANPTFMLDSFSDSGSNGITWLMEYFCVPKEDADGNLVNEYEQENYRDALLWLNELYRAKLISPANFTAGAGTLTAYIQQGMPFAFIGSPQLYTNAFGQALKQGIEYVPVVITNDKKEAPLLRDLSGPGWLMSMITNNCEHPDRVIKLFDYLNSLEGQSLFFGVENETYTYDIRPGETVDGTYYKYGKIRWTDEVEQKIIDGDVSEYGFMYSNIFVNPMYPRLASPAGAVLNSYNDYIDHNIKAAISDFTYSINGFAFTRDVQAENYKDIVSKSSKISDEWVTYFPQIISADSRDSALAIYQSTVASAKRLGADEVLAFDNATFLAYKQKLGITYAWPKNDPASGYSQLQVTNILGNTAYNLEIPAKYLK